MRTTLRCLFLTAVLAAGCNESQPGEGGLLRFTPTECGNPLLGCSFERPIATGGRLWVEVTSQIAASTAGLTLTSSAPDVLAATDIVDVDGRPTWDLTAGRAGEAVITAVDSLGEPVDQLAVTVAAPTRIGLVKLAGTATGPTPEPPHDEAWTITAGAPVSFQAVAYAGTTQLMGRLAFTFSTPPGSTLLDTETSASDREVGYLYVQPPAGDYPFVFARADIDGSLAVDVILHAR